MPNCVWESLFKLNTLGRAGTDSDLASIGELETLELSIDGTVQDWYAIGADGFAQNLVTAKKITFSGTAKRSVGDTGNDYLFSLFLGVGSGCQTKFKLEFPDGDTLSGNVNVNVTTLLGGATDVAPIAFEVHCDGKPTYVNSSALPVLTFVCADHATAGATKIDSVSPALTGGNSYLYKPNAELPSVGDDLTGQAWTAYTLAAAMPAINGWTITLVEVSTGDVVVKGGQALAVVT